MIINWEGEEELERKRRGRRGRVGLRYKLITPGVKTILKVLEILILGGNHPSKLIVPFPNKVMKGTKLRMDISP